MLFSIYPSDTADVREAVVAQALASGGGTVFTSLHIPETSGLERFGDYLADLHRRHGLTFCADVSPGTLGQLSCDIDDLGRLRGWGVDTVRIDFGFDADETRRIAASGGFRIAVNASTADADLLDLLDGLDLVGWHNFYPRPETGLSEAYFVAQSELFTRRGLDLFTFIPGELSFRAPLHLGLPTLEAQRHRNAYVNTLEVRRHAPASAVVCAEGTLLPDHLDWIARLEADGEVTVPLVAVDACVDFLREGTWRLRPEGTDTSLRIEDTRGTRTVARPVNGSCRGQGSLQMDRQTAGRYAGELHLMTTDRPLTDLQVRVADVAPAYRALVEHLAPGSRVRFVW